jgi:hypothetical protein
MPLLGFFPHQYPRSCREFWDYIGVRLILTGREPVMRISTSLLALCCQSGLDAALDTPNQGLGMPQNTCDRRQSPVI